MHRSSATLERCHTPSGAMRSSRKSGAAGASTILMCVHHPQRSLLVSCNSRASVHSSLVQALSEGWISDCSDRTNRCTFRNHVVCPVSDKRCACAVQRALLRTASEVAKGLDFMHGLGVVHGDLKPANVLLKTHRADRRGYVAKVADFGVPLLILHVGFCMLGFFTRLLLSQSICCPTQLQGTPMLACQ
jgi:hypothetical protein